MRFLVILLLLTAMSTADTATDFIAAARQTHGAEGERAARFLLDNMPDHDRIQLDCGFLSENLNLAFRTRTNFPWARALPEELFLNNVLPYAVANEPREAWRPHYFEMAGQLAQDAQSATEAVQLLNRDLFNAINVHYSTERERANQSPSESIKQGKASYTGLSIILVDACRAIGIPARIAGTPLWSNKRGNHTWVEYWDSGWHFVGADEYDPKGVDDGWFVNDAVQADEKNPQHAIYATSWEKTGIHFPMVWTPSDTSVPAINVTSRYVQTPSQPQNRLGIRLYSKPDNRIATECQLVAEDGQVIATFQTRGESADMNDVPEVVVEPGHRYRVRIREQQTDLFTAEAGITTKNVYASNFKPIPEGLTKREIDEHIQMAYSKLLEETRDARQQELNAKAITLGNHTLVWKEKTFGKAPRNGHSLWISMHGGGNAPTELNDSQWKNQADLYEPKEGIYIAPRAPTDTWNLWHEAHIDSLFARLIENMIALREVDPNRIYLMGYSAGGDGVWQLAPRMADRFAAASMMAGHPNEASLLGLRNLPFAIFVGAEDCDYNRNTIAEEKAGKLDDLHKKDPEGYIHLFRSYKGMGHWMDRKDAEALPWMADFERNPWPQKIVWFQDDVTHDRFYWIQLPPGTAQKGDQIIATVDKQQIVIDGDVPKGTRIRLSDQLLDLNRPVSLSINGKKVFSGKAERCASVVQATLAERLDPASAACAEIIYE